MEELEIKALTSTTLVSVDADRVVVGNAKGEASRIDVDTVLVSGPRKANHDLFNDFLWMIDELHGAGDALMPRGLDASIHEGFKIGVRI